MGRALKLNDAGVVIGGHETISLLSRGFSWAEIKVAEVDDGGWICATSWQTSVCGKTKPLMPARARRSSTRSDAIRLAASVILAELEVRDDRLHPELCNIRARCQELLAPQLDLFERA